MGRDKKSKPPKGAVAKHEKLVVSKLRRISAAADRGEHGPDNCGKNDSSVDVEDATFHCPMDPEDVNIVQSCVKMKLSQFCPDQRIQRLLNKTVLDVNYVLSEAYAFANFHLERTMGKHRIVDVGAKFYDRCIIAISDCTTKGGSLEPDMKKSADLFAQLRPLDQGRVDMKLLNEVKSELVKSMAAMTLNHLRTNLGGRLNRYMVWRHPCLSNTLRKLVTRYTVEFPMEDIAKVNALSLKVNDRERPRDAKLRILKARELISTFRSLCPMKKNVKYHTESEVADLLPIYKMIKDETDEEFYMSKNHLKLGAKHNMILFKRLNKARFTLLPLKNGFTTSYIPICGRAWISILRRVKDSRGVSVTVLKTNRPSDDKMDHEWRAHCNINMLETISRRFGGRFSTDGYAVTVGMTTVQALILPEVNGEWDPSRIEDLRGEKKLDFVGIDPGLTDVVTIARKSNGKVSSYSSSRYYEDSKVKVSNRRTSKWNAETKELSDDLKNHPKDFYKTYLSVSRDLIKHRTKRGYRGMRFMRYCFKQKSVQKICDMIAPRDEFTVVGFGDWKGPKDSPINRRFCGPLQDIKRELQRRPKEVLFRSVWEYRTSKVCHKTRTDLSNMVAKSTTWDRYSGGFVKREASKVHKILHCKSSKNSKWSLGATWNRDANAARNILMLLQLEVDGKERPIEFCPTQMYPRRTMIKKRGTLAATPSRVHGHPLSVVLPSLGNIQG